MKNKKNGRWRFQVTIIFILFILSSIFVLADTSIDRSAKRKKIQLELFWGKNWLNPQNFNLLAQVENEYIRAFYDNGQAKYDPWRKERTGEFGKINESFPLGGRIKYYLAPDWAVSLGLSCFSRTESSDVRIEYSMKNSERWYYDIIDYPVYELAVSTVIPQLGFWGEFDVVRNTIKLSGFLTVGWSFVQCSYQKERKNTARIYEIQEDRDYSEFTSTIAYQETGSGSGLAVDLGLRVDVLVFKNLGIFMENSYHFQSIGNISGPGSETVNGKVNQTWEGDWKVRVENFYHLWKDYSFQYPTAYQENAGPGTYFTAFVLDLSGFVLKGGIFYRF